MGKVLGDSPKEDFPMPDKVVVVPVDLDPSNECVRVVPMAFVKGTEPAACGARRQSVPPAAPGAPPGAPGVPGTTPPPGPQTGIAPLSRALAGSLANGVGSLAPAPAAVRESEPVRPPASTIQGQ
jgi:hypothetical protein